MRVTQRPLTIQPYCDAPLWLHLRGQDYPILPSLAAKYLLVPFALLALLIVVLEVRLRVLADERVVLGINWQLEDSRINEMNAQKIRQTISDRRWHSAGIPWTDKSDKRKRILIVGDSFTWGSGNLNANEIWWRQLARELQRRGYWDVDVTALCAQGASTEDQLDWLRDQKWLQRVGPDLVIFGYVTNDPAIRAPGGGFLVRQIGGDVSLPDWDLLDQTLGVVAPNLNVQIKNLLTRKWQSTIKDAYEYREWELRILEEPNLGRYRAVLRNLSQFLTSSNTPHVFVSLPNAPAPAVYGPRFSRVEPLFEDAKIPFRNLLGDFVNEYGEASSEIEWGINPANGHPGPKSTRFYALKVADLLEQRYPRSLGLRSSQPATLRPVINDWMPPSADVHEVEPGSWEFTLPDTKTLAPSLPIGKAHSVLSFEHPVAITAVRARVAEDERVELFATVLDPTTRIERKELLELGVRRGPLLEWFFPQAQLVHTLRLAGHSGSSRVRMMIEFESPAVRP